MIEKFAAVLIALSPLTMSKGEGMVPPVPTHQESPSTCVNIEMYVNKVAQTYDISVAEILRDSRVEKVTDTVRNLTTALDDQVSDPTAYVLLTLENEPIAMLIPVFGICAASPLYMDQGFYEKTRGDPL